VTHDPTTLLAADADARQAAVTVFDRPFALAAGAGTGKTSTLVARALAWCLGPGWERAASLAPAGSPASTDDAVAIAGVVFERLVAITFTEAAAAEMATRIGDALAALADADPDRDELPPGVPRALASAALPAPVERRRRAAALHQSLDRLTARTIHGFCHGLLAAHPFAAGIHPAFVVDADGSRLEEACREALERLLGRELAAPLPAPQAAVAGPLVRLLARRISPEELLATVVAWRDRGVEPAALAVDPLGALALRRWYDEALAAHVDLERLAGRELALARGAVTQAAVEALADGRRRLVEATAAAGGGALRSALGAGWPERARGRVADWEKGKLTAGESAALGPRAADFALAAGRLRDALDALLDLDQALLGDLRAVLVPLYAEVAERLHAAGVLGFGELLRGAVALLAGHPELARRLRRGLDQLLVDEFQDTDAVQCRLIAHLALDGPADERPGLFLVGDPKQSIYGWRDADLAAYEAFLGRLDALGGCRHQLAANFRSTPGILAEVERALAPVMRRVPGLQPSFEPLVAARVQPTEPTPTAASAPAAVSWWVSWGTGDDGKAARPRSEDARAREAAALVADLAAARAEGRLARWSDAAVLLRSFTDTDEILAALRVAGIPFTVTRDRSYYRRREVIEAAAWLRTVVDPADHLALVTVLRSAGVGVPDAGLLALWRLGVPDLLTTSDLAGVMDLVLARIRQAAAAPVAGVPGWERVAGWGLSLERFVGVLTELRAAFERESIDRFIERLRRLTVIEATEAARYLGRHRVANLDRFFASVIETMEASAGDHGALLRLLRQHVAGTREAAEALVPAGGDDAVQVGTIHAAKGLEFGHVYLLQLDRQAGGRGNDGAGAVELDGHWELGYLAGVSTLGYRSAMRRQRRIAEHELLRLLYVGMTRARDRLVLAGSWGLPGAGQAGGSASDTSLLARLAHRPPSGLLASLAESAPDDGVADDGVADDGVADGDAASWRRLPPADPDGAAARQDAGDEGFEPLLPPASAVAAVADRLAALRAAATAHQARPWRTAASAEAHRLLAVEHEGDDAREPPAPAGVGRAHALAIGTALHAALEGLDLTGDHDLGSELRQRFADQLAALLPADQVATAGRAAAGLVRTVAEGRLLRRLRELAEHIVARELPVLLAPATMLGNAAPPSAGATGYVAGAVDLVYRDPADGSVVVVDYKTDLVRDEQAMAKKLLTYAPQLQTYAVGLAAAWGLAGPPRCQLWLLAADRIEEVAAGR
jgi:ATP-dependent helicase/nuclease subunit A